MPSMASLTDPKVYHILSYSTLLGSTFFQTFMAGPLAFTCLPRAQFSTLQQKIFPPFFWLQTLMPLAMAVTWPGEKVAGAVGLGVARKNDGWRGLLDESNIWEVTLPIVLMFVTAAINVVAFGPATTKIMRTRKRQETRDGKRYHDAGPHSAEMQSLNKQFMWMHSASSLSNVIGLGAMLYYGVVLADML